MQLYNYRTRKVEELKPLKYDHIAMYCCGPTVYDYAHIGNFRTYLFEDFLVRLLIHLSLKVNHVMNITDVGHLVSDADEGEDKMLKGAKREGKTVWQIAEHYTDAFLVDAEKLSIKKPNVICKATDHIQEMIDLIKRLEDQGFTYVADGNVYFDVSKFKSYPDYGRLDLEGMQAGARVEVDSAKKNPFDFALWFTRSKFTDQEMKWDSPWGLGYPGWHIECSAMSMKYLGEQFDIHCGAIDHIPVHHTNEIAQSEAATGKQFVTTWLEGGHLLVEGKRMSKSEGTGYTLDDLAEKGFTPRDFRYLCLASHYRQTLNFTWDSIQGAQNTLKGLDDLVLRLHEVSQEGGLSKEEEARLLALHRGVLEAMQDDLNTPQALSVLFEEIKHWNTLLAEGAMTMSHAHHVIELLKVFDSVWKVLDFSQNIEVPADISKLVEERNAAKASKDYTKSDEIRDELLAKGWVLEDTKDGVRVKRG